MSPIHRYTAADYDRIILRERRYDENTRAVIEDFKAWEQYKHCIDKVDLITEKRQLRLGEQLKIDEEREKAIARAQREKIIREEQEKQEEALCEELSRLKLEKERDAKMRQQILETSPELRELQSLLKAAYTTKQLDAQVAEKEAHKFDEKSRDVEAARVMAEKEKRDEREEQRREMIRYNSMKKYYADLHLQMGEKVVRQELKAEDTLKDKMVVDDILRKIYAEDMRNFERKRLNQDALRRQMAEDEQRRVEKAQEEHKRNLLEEERFTKYGQELVLRDEQRKASKSNSQEQRERIQREIASKTFAKEAHDREVEEMRIELSQEQQAEKERLIDVRAEEKRQRLHEEMIKGMKWAGMEKEAHLQQERERETFYAQQIREKFIKDTLEEQAKIAKQRAMKMEMGQMTRKLVAEHQREHLLQREREMSEINEKKKFSEFQRQLIEEERRRLLLEHGPQLLGYMPKGVIRNETDLELLGEDYKRAYARRGNDAIALSRVFMP